jgi:RimJ/RimL family protein N-acetyltransferase
VSQPWLVTDRLQLRTVTVEDAPLLLALDGDPEVMRYIGPHGLPDEAAYRLRIEKVWQRYYEEQPGLGFWAAEERGSGAFVGWFVLRPATDYKYAQEAEAQPGEIELGYRTHQAFWGRGYATEVARALVRHAFVTVGAARVVGYVLETNRASARVLEKAGLVRQGQFVLPGYEPLAVRYALDREEYRPVTAAR